MEKQEFVELFKEAIEDGDIKLVLEKDKYLGGTTVYVSLQDKQGKILTQDSVSL